MYIFLDLSSTFILLSLTTSVHPLSYSFPISCSFSAPISWWHFNLPFLTSSRQHFFYASWVSIAVSLTSAVHLLSRFLFLLLFFISTLLKICWWNSNISVVYCSIYSLSHVFFFCFHSAFLNFFSPMFLFLLLFPFLSRANLLMTLQHLIPSFFHILFLFGSFYFHSASINFCRSLPCACLFSLFFPGYNSLMFLLFQFCLHLTSAVHLLSHVPLFPFFFQVIFL